VHSITDCIIRGQPTINHVLPCFVDFLSNPDPIVLAHNALFALGVLAMALTRLGMGYPPPSAT
jgi:DNA polymerase III epsilon subunit-like protein